MTDEWLDEKITVCAECLMASCWQGIFMCEKSRNADITQRSRRELIALGREHHCYMKNDEELQTGD